jgi:hypothetical protein
MQPIGSSEEGTMYLGEATSMSRVCCNSIDTLGIIKAAFHFLGAVWFSVVWFRLSVVFGLGLF